MSGFLLISGVGLPSAAWPENGLQGGLVLDTAVVFSATLSVVILAFALNGRGFIAVFTCVGGPLQLAV